MKWVAALAAVALSVLVGSARSQEPVPFDYRCDAAAAATMPAALPADGWQRANDGQLPGAFGNPCWLRIDVARFSPRILRATSARQTMEIAMYSHDGRPLAAARHAGPPEQVIVGADGVASHMLFPTLRAEDGPVLMRVQRSRRVSIAAVDLAEAVQAERTALDMIEMIALFNREPDRAGKPVIAIGIGIASGDVIAGYTGTQNRATYTCVGDAVNLAARLEAHTKTAGFPILIDEATRSALGERCEVQGLGAVSIKGKAAAVTVFSLHAGQTVRD